MSDIRLDEEFYKKRFLRYGSSNHYSGYPDKNTQLKTISQVIDLLKIKKWKGMSSILEVGCGYGAFMKFADSAAKQHKKLFSYLGLDTNLKATEMATLQHGEMFLYKDLMEFNRDQKWDYVICTGMLPNERPIKEVLERMLSYCNKRIIVEIFMRHDFLHCINYEEQIHLMRSFPKTDAIRFNNNSLIWSISKY